MLLIASYFFYGWWDWRFLSLIFISTVTDYICGIQIYNHQRPEGKKRFLIISVIVNLSLLGFFKYWNFFTENFVAIISTLGLHPNLATLNIILPVGISFYTFQTMTYSIDIYRGELEPTHNFFDFALFVSFFPQLVAGPIERAINLLPQIQNDRHFDKDQLLRGLHLIFWGLFKKVFVADNLGIIVDDVFSNPESTGMEYFLGSWAFAFQIYGDFSGYSDIARGVAKCLGFELMHNFRQPYFAINPPDLWRRWHISLTTWLTDYLYIPLGGSRKGPWKTYRNLMLTMTLCGLWHGAGWNYVLWGVYQGVLLVSHRLIRTPKSKYLPQHPSLAIYMFKAFLIFQSFCIGLLIFRAQSLSQMKFIFLSLLSSFYWTPLASQMLVKVIFFSFIPTLAMAFQTLKEVRSEWFMEKLWMRYFDFSHQPIYLRTILYSTLTYLLCLYGAETETFFYFQF